MKYITVDPSKVRQVRLAPHFMAYEFRCPDCGLVVVADELLARLELLREKVNSPILITSGYRCPTYNAKAGGAKNSRHLYGEAADIVVQKLVADAVYDLALQFFPRVGLYYSQLGGFVHVDVYTGSSVKYWYRNKDGRYVYVNDPDKVRSMFLQEWRKPGTQVAKGGNAD